MSTAHDPAPERPAILRFVESYQRALNRSWHGGNRCDDGGRCAAAAERALTAHPGPVGELIRNPPH